MKWGMRLTYCKPSQQSRNVNCQKIPYIRWILSEALAIGITVYGSTIFKEIHNDGSFYVPEDCQHDLLSWLPYLELFLYQKVSEFSRRGLSFRLRLIVANPMFHPFVNIFYLKHASPYTSHFSVNFIWLPILIYQISDDRSQFKHLSRLGLKNTLTAFLQRGKTPPSPAHLTSTLDMALNCIWWCGSSPRALVNVEYFFIAITPRSTLTWSVSTY